MRLLLIETSTERGMIAYLHDQALLFLKEFPFGLNQSKYLIPSLNEALCQFDFSKELEVIGVGIGPGSYTGMRLGVSVAQALAYSWKIPLIGIPTLNGFVPQRKEVSFAAVLDARMGGLYFRKGWKGADGRVVYEGECQILSLEEALTELKTVSHLVTPTVDQLQKKFTHGSSELKWTWEESSPSPIALLKYVEEQGTPKKNFPPTTPLELLYLR